ncbi:hypothetical protein ACFY93_21920 [Streptomyces sp. NPDC008313]|uniref:hypothetical protein n=1 Tax=Streptomyces sp. NPDC008313 TaxID=3364826 RepID=UPI0036E686C4
MNALLMAAAFLVLVAAAVYVIHRLDLQHADRIAAYRYSAPRPGHRVRSVPQPYQAPRVIIQASARPPGRASEPSARSAATHARDVHPGPGPGEVRPKPVDRDT